MSKEKILKKMYQAVKENPGIRAMELGKKVNLDHSWNYRKILIKKGLIRKEKDGAAVRYYPVEK